MVEVNNKIEDIIRRFNLEKDEWVHFTKGEIIRFGRLLFFQKGKEIKKMSLTRDPGDTQLEFKQGVTFERMQQEKDGWICSSSKPIAIVKIGKEFEEITRQGTGEIEVTLDRVSNYPEIGHSIDIEARIHITGRGIKMLIFNMEEQDDETDETTNTPRGIPDSTESK